MSYTRWEIECVLVDAPDEKDELLPRGFQTVLEEIISQHDGDGEPCLDCDSAVGWLLDDETGRMWWTSVGLARLSGGDVTILCEHCMPDIPLGRLK